MAQSGMLSLFIVVAQYSCLIFNSESFRGNLALLISFVWEGEV